MDEDDEVVLAVAGYIGNERLARFGGVAAAVAEGALLEDLPAVRGRELRRLVEGHDVEVVLRGFEEDEILAAVLVQVAGDDISEPTVLDGRLVAVQLSHVPDLAAEGQPRGGVQSEEGQSVWLARAESHGAEGGELGDGQRKAAGDLPDPRAVTLRHGKLLALGVEQEEQGGLAAIGQRGRADEPRVAGRAVDLIFHDKRRAGLRVAGLAVALEDHGAKEVLLREKQLHFAVAVHIGEAEPRLLHRTTGWSHVHLGEVLAGRVEQHLDLLVRREHDEIRLAVLVGVVEEERAGVGLEGLGELLRARLRAGKLRDERALTVRVHDDGERRLGPRCQQADGHGQRAAFQSDGLWKRDAAARLNLAHAQLAFIRAQHEDLRLPVPVPVRDGEFGDAGERGKLLRRAERAIFLLEINTELPAVRLGHEQVGEAVLVHVGPGAAPPGLVRAVERKDLKLALFERTDERLGGLLHEAGDLCAAGLHRDGQQLGLAVAVEVVSPEGADLREGEVQFRAELAGGVLKAEADGVLVLPVDEQQVVAPVAVHVEDLDGLDAAGEGHLLRLGERVVGLLEEHPDVRLGKDDEVGELVPIEIAGDEGVLRELRVIKRDVARCGPGALAGVELDDELLRLAVVGEVRSAVGVEVGDGKRGDALLGRDGVNAEAGVGRQLVEVGATGGGLDFRGVAGAVVKERDFGAEIVHHQQIAQAVPVKVSGLQLSDQEVHREDFRAGEPKAHRGRTGCGGGAGEGQPKHRQPERKRSKGGCHGKLPAD